MLTRKILKIKIFVILTLSLIGLSNGLSQKQNLKVLVIGNSLVYWNNFHENFENTCKQNGKNIYLKTIAYPGIELMEHFKFCPDSSKGYTVLNLCPNKKPPAIEALKSNLWDIVILQNPDYDGSIFPQEVIDSVRIYGGNQCKIFIYEQFSTILYSYAKRNTEVINIQTALRKNLKNSDVKYLPIGEVFHFVSTNYPNLDIFDKDYEHPNPIGSFLQLGIIYKSIYKEFPKKKKFLFFSKYNKLITILRQYDSRKT